MKILVDKLKKYSICLFFMFLFFDINTIYWYGSINNKTPSFFDLMLYFLFYIIIFIPYLVIFLPLLLLVFIVSDFILYIKKTFYLNIILCFILILSVLLLTNSLIFYIWDVITTDSFEDEAPLTLLMNDIIYKNGSFIIRTLYAGYFYFHCHGHYILIPCLLTTITFFIVHYYWARKIKNSDAATLNPKS